MSAQAPAAAPETGTITVSFDPPGLIHHTEDGDVFEPDEPIQIFGDDLALLDAVKRGMGE